MKPRSFSCRIRDICPDASRFGSLQRCARKDTDTSFMAALTVLWRILDLLVAPNWFLCTDAKNDETSIVFSPCGILSRNLFLMHVC